MTPYRDWINLFDDDVFLLGPFDFASFNGRRSKDRIDASLWASLSEQTSKFENTVPSWSTSEHLVYYVDTQHHSSHSNESISQSISNILFTRHMSM